MSDVRTFGNIDPSKRKRETFTLQGLYEYDVEMDGEVLHKEDDQWSETFECLSKVPAKVLDGLISSVGISKSGAVSVDNLRVCGFIRSCVHPRDRQRWDALMDDDARVMALDDLVPIMEVLTGGLFGRPTPPPSS